MAPAEVLKARAVRTSEKRIRRSPLLNFHLRLCPLWFMVEHYHLRTPPFNMKIRIKILAFQKSESLVLLIRFLDSVLTVK
jgi:hypothetical protein